MVFVVIQIRAHCRVVKSWYGCIVADHAALIDLYHKYSSGQLDNSEPTSDQYAVTGMITRALGRSKTDYLVRVSVDVPVGEAVSSLGNHVDFNVDLQTISEPLPLAVFHIKKLTVSDKFKF